MTERDRQRERTRQRVFESALTIFQRDGVEAARVEDITQLAGVSRATFYFHFSTKDDVILRVLMESEERQAERLAALPEDTSLPEVLATFADDMAREWEGRRELLTGLGHVALRQLSRGIDELRDAHPARAALAPFVQRAIDRGEILSGPVPGEVVADFVLMNLFVAALTWVGQPVMPLGDMLQVVVALFLRATRPE